MTAPYKTFGSCGTWEILFLKAGGPGFLEVA